MNDDILPLTLRFRRKLRALSVQLGLASDPGDDAIAAAAPDIVSYQGHRFDIRHPRCTAPIAAALVQGCYEEREIALIRRFVKAQDRVLELGACMGATTMVLHDIVGRERLLVVEADPRNLAMSRHQFALNGLDIRISHGVLVAGGTLPEAVPFASNSNPSSSSLADRAGAEAWQSVPALSFEKALQDERSTTLVLDIEGGELDLFVRAKSLGSLRQIIMETHPHVIGPEGMQQMHAALKRFGFVVHRSYREGQFLVMRKGQG